MIGLLRNLAHRVYLVPMSMNMTAGNVPQWTITDRLRKSRELTGLDQIEFADRIGVSRGTVSNYERGSKSHQKSTLMTWAMGSGVPLEWLLTGQESSPTSPSSAANGHTVEYSHRRLTLAQAA